MENLKELIITSAYLPNMEKITKNQGDGGCRQLLQEQDKETHHWM